MDLGMLDEWRRNLGLSAFPLWPGSTASRSYVLLNGSRGNLCLDVEGREPGSQTRSETWSSNVGHFVAVQADQVLVQRWDERLPRRYRRSEVEDDLEGFHRYLEQAEPHPDASVVAHVLKVFRHLRTVLGSNVSGPEALDALLALIASGIERKPPEDIGRLEYAIPETGIHLAQAMSPADWEMLVEQLTATRTSDEIKPELRLLLRHSSGLLFQEAHFAALFRSDSQLHFAGLPQESVRLAKKPAALGVYFTPPALARALAEEAVGRLSPAEELTVLDPACGSGEFLREAIRQIRRCGFSGHVRLIGFDLSEAAIDMARFSLNLEYFNDKFTTLQLERRDSLDEQEWPKADLILMNPPFVSWQDMDRETRPRVKTLLGDLVKGRPDMAAAFVFRASASLRPGGLLGTIVPASFFDATSSVGLRADLAAKTASLVHARLGSQSIFPSATVDAAFFLVREGQGPSSALAFWADPRPSSVSRGLRLLRKIRQSPEEAVLPVIEKGLSLYVDGSLGKDSDHWVPQPYSEWRALRAAEDMPRVGTLFSVHQGARTGANPVFLLSRTEFEGLPEAERRFFRPAVVNASIVAGQLEETSYVFFPYGEHELASEEKLRNALPTYVAEYLEHHQESLRARGKRFEQQWWLLTRHRPWQVRPRRKVITTYFGERGSFTLDSTGGFVVVQGHAWIPRRPRKLTHTIATAYVALLNSDHFLRVVAAVSPQVGGGQWNLSKKYMELLPLPDLWTSDARDEVLLGLAEIGEVILSEGLSALSGDQFMALRELGSVAYRATT